MLSVMGSLDRLLRIFFQNGGGGGGILVDNIKPSVLFESISLIILALDFM